MKSVFADVDRDIFIAIAVECIELIFEIVRPLNPMTETLSAFFSREITHGEVASEGEVSAAVEPDNEIIRAVARTEGEAAD